MLLFWAEEEANSRGDCGKAKTKRCCTRWSQLDGNKIRTERKHMRTAGEMLGSTFFDRVSGCFFFGERFPAYFGIARTVRIQFETRSVCSLSVERHAAAAAAETRKAEKEVRLMSRLYGYMEESGVLYAAVCCEHTRSSLCIMCVCHRTALNKAKRANLYGLNWRMLFGH